MAFSITVVFPNDADAEYDIDYYTRNHMPLIEKHWSKFGLKGSFQAWMVASRCMPLAVKSSGKARRALRMHLRVPRLQKLWAIFLASATSHLFSWLGRS
jgi:hypothetical protein